MTKPALAGWRIRWLSLALREAPPKERAGVATSGGKSRGQLRRCEIVARSEYLPGAGPAYIILHSDCRSVFLPGS